jgi:hypothetical protein
MGMEQEMEIGLKRKCSFSYFARKFREKSFRKVAEITKIFAKVFKKIDAEVFAKTKIDAKTFAKDFAEMIIFVKYNINQASSQFFGLTFCDIS